MKMKKIISALLAFLMVFGSVSVLFATPAYADDSTTAEGETTTDGTTEGEGTGEEEEEAPITGGEDVDTSGFTWETYVKNALNRGYKSVDDMLASKYEMFKLMMSTDRYELYANQYTGDVVLKDKATGQYLTSNPTNLAGVTSTVKEELLSQVVVKFEQNGSEQTFYSYKMAAQNGQVNVSKIKNGVRVEYSIGDPVSEFLIPYWATKESFEEKILAAMEANGLAPTDWVYGVVKNYYILKDPNDPKYTEAQLQDMYTNFPITKKGVAIYVLQNSTTESEKEQAKLENYVGIYTSYTWEDQQNDIAETGYVSKVSDPPVFKVALEYTLTDYGLQVDLPANSIRFNEDSYKLKDISILQYMGSADINNEGYVFYPDGSGALLDFTDLRTANSTTKGNGNSISGKVYGQDYAYQVVTGAHISTISLPIYGIVNTQHVQTNTENYYRSNGFLAIISNGDSLASLKAGSSNTHYYASVYPTFYPRPTDTYFLSDSTSVSNTSNALSIESSRKYTDRYIINYVMLSDDVLATEAVEKGTIDSYYPSTWVGMAMAYRDYLEDKGILTQLSAAEVEDTLPLYIETFGTIPSVERVLSIPVNVNAPLTTFEQVKAMYDELSAEGISNINFKLTGYANGGLNATYPAKLKWMKELGGKSGYEDLVAYASENGFGVYPDFDFSYVTYTDTGDGISIKQVLARTINDRYASKQVYDVALQRFMNYFNLCVSSNVMEDLYNKFLKKWQKSENIGISVSTLGSDLNSDFNEDDPQNREDAKNTVTALFKTISETNASVMTDGGNAYTLQYVDHILDAAIDNSRYNKASADVPFVGFLLHGYKNFAGGAINMAGDIEYQLLKSIENGASPYFILSYDNTDILKEWFTWSQYYSINYEIWFEEMIEIYKLLDEAIGDLQSIRLTNHTFLAGTRVYDDLDIENNANAEAEITEKSKEEALMQAQAEILAAYRKLFSEGYIASGLTSKDVPEVIKVVDEVLVDRKAQMEKYDAIVAEINASGRADVVATIEALALEIAALSSRSSALTVAIASATDSTEKAALTAEKEQIEAEMAAKAEESANHTVSLENYEPQYTENKTLLDFYMAEVELYTEMRAMLIRNTEDLDKVVSDYVAAAIQAYYDEIAFAYDVNDDIICVEYENGVIFILNYNAFSVEVEYDGETHTIESYGFVRID